MAAQKCGDKDNAVISIARTNNPRAGIRPISSTGIAIDRSFEAI